MSKAVKKSTISAVPAEPKNRPIITLTAQATDKHPGADPNPIMHLSVMARDIERLADHLESVYDLGAMDEDNPILSGCCTFLFEIIKRLREDVEYITDIGDSLTVKGGNE